MATETAILAGGCFWGAQELLRKRPGVISTRVGYSGGDVPNATYRNHGDHAEAVEIVFDPEVISFREILEFFFQIHDPSTKNRQGNDVGRSYRSAIYYTSDEQRQVALDTIADVDASGLWPGKVVTEVVEAGPFWEAEPEHQDYLQKIPVRLHVPLRAAGLGAPEAGDAVRLISLRPRRREQLHRCARHDRQWSVVSSAPGPGPASRTARRATAARCALVHPDTSRPAWLRW